MHEIYRVYFEKVRIKKFTTAYETVEFYLKQMEKQIRFPTSSDSRDNLYSTVILFLYNFMEIKTTSNLHM